MRENETNQQHQQANFQLHQEKQASEPPPTTKTNEANKKARRGGVAPTSSQRTPHLLTSPIRWRLLHTTTILVPICGVHQANGNNFTVESTGHDFVERPEPDGEHSL
mmetsp:Transcript_12294/g.35540  ORF Transcript_12294/g.35540 Transcript_12294/m.35540 type:complete len:107 (+) Transcript_12294:76-396(+)